jgi:hypothetical protein
VDDQPKRLRAGLGNALIWGGAWAIGSVVLLTVSVLMGLTPTLPPLGGLLRIAARFGLTGIAAGASFSAFLRYVYGGERLKGIPSVPFVLGGALVAGVVAPLVGGTALIAALLGGGTAGITLAAAKSAERRMVGPGRGDAALEGEVSSLGRDHD